MSDTTQQATLRAEFEAWAKRDMPRLSLVWALGGYGFTYTNMAWLGWQAARSAAPDPATVAPTDLHSAIMNLPCAPTDATKREFGGNVGMLAYKLGHRDARHAAAELVSATPADKGDVGLLREVPRVTGQDMSAAAELMSKWGVEDIWQTDLEKVAVGLATLRQRLEGKES